MKTLISAIVLFFIFAIFPFSLQAKSKINLPEIYGKDLYSVPALIRIKYQNETGRAWHDTSYDERTAFLTNWYAEKDAVARKEKDREKQNLLDEKEKQRVRKDKLRVKKDKEKAKREKEKAVEKEKKERRKKLKDLEKKRKEALRRLKKAQRNKH